MKRKRITPNNPPKGYHYYSAHTYDNKTLADRHKKSKLKNEKIVIHKHKYGPGYTNYVFKKNSKKAKSMRGYIR